MCAQSQAQLLGSGQLANHIQMSPNSEFVVLDISTSFKLLDRDKLGPSPILFFINEILRTFKWPILAAWLIQHWNLKFYSDRPINVANVILCIQSNR